MVYYRRCKPSANLLQGFSKRETNNFPRSPATRGRELKHRRHRRQRKEAKSPATRGRELKRGHSKSRYPGHTSPATRGRELKLYSLNSSRAQVSRPPRAGVN